MVYLYILQSKTTGRYYIGVIQGYHTTFPFAIQLTANSSSCSRAALAPIKSWVATENNPNSIRTDGNTTQSAF